MQLKMA
jgi:hypothetical protein